MSIVNVLLTTILTLISGTERNQYQYAVSSELKVVFTLEFLLKYQVQSIGDHTLKWKKNIRV